MSKILFIEDELTSNVETIIRLFTPILPEEILQKLKSTNFDYPEDIVDLCSENSPLDIAYSFPQALTKIIAGHSDYDLILIDRNLERSPYDKDLEQICIQLEGIGFDKIKERIHIFKDREGDLLLQALLKKDKNAKNIAYFVTANINDTLRDSRELQNMLDIDSFLGNHIIEKGSPQEDNIPRILRDLHSFRIENQYPQQCRILRNRLCEDDVNMFISVIKYLEADKIKEFLFFLRKLMDNLLHHIAVTVGDFDAPYWNAINNKQLVIKYFINGRRNQYGKWFGLRQLAEDIGFGYGSIARDACLSIAEISSDCGVHELSTAIDIKNLNVEALSHWTQNSLLNQICDVIIWYDKVIEKLSK